MSFSFKLRSHPDKFLIDHLRNVGTYCRDIISSKKIENDLFSAKFGYLIGVSHDFGKGTEYFQNLLHGGERSVYSNHGFLSALFGYYLLKEFISEVNKSDEFWHIPAVAWIVISKHHTDIRDIQDEISDTQINNLRDKREIEICRAQTENIREKHIDEFKEIYKCLLNNMLYENPTKFLEEFIDIFNTQKHIERFTREICNTIFKLSRKNDIRYYFDILFFYSVLLDADKLDASGTDAPQRIDFSGDCIDKYKEIKFGESKTEIAKIREQAYSEVISAIHNIDLKNKRLLSINLPTGIGKTLTGLAFAVRLRKKVKEQFGFTPRIIYALPFLSIIDQNSDIIKEVLLLGDEKYKEIPSNLFLKHHHLADIEYRAKKEDNSELETIKDISKALLLTESWHSEIIITTFVQFFHSLITNKNRAARKFHNMLNSIIILDEVQSIPHKYWFLLNHILTYMVKNFNCWVILMTATQPLIFEKEEVRSIVKNKEKYFNKFNRVRFEFDLNRKDFNSFKEEILENILSEKNKNIMIVLNTINSCKNMYNYIKNKLAEKHNVNSDECLDTDGICVFPDLSLITLSTHILPEFRLRRINRIRSVNDKRKVIITTQLIEAGVDISVDIIYRDFAPLDCIIQTAGRCNRNNEYDEGIVRVVKLIRAEDSRPFCSYVYDSTLLDATEEVIRCFGSAVCEKSFVTHAADKYYSLVMNRSSKNESAEFLKDIGNLNFSNISNFALIDEKKTTSIYVEIDERAVDIRKRIEEIINWEKGFKRREDLLKFKKDLNEYTLSIRSMDSLITSLLPCVGTIEDLRYIPHADLKRWYKLDTGIELPNQQDACIIF